MRGLLVLLALTGCRDERTVTGDHPKGRVEVTTWADGPDKRVGEVSIHIADEPMTVVHVPTPFYGGCIPKSTYYQDVDSTQFRDLRVSDGKGNVILEKE